MDRFPLRRPVGFSNRPTLRAQFFNFAPTYPALWFAPERVESPHPNVSFQPFSAQQAALETTLPEAS